VEVGQGFGQRHAGLELANEVGAQLGTGDRLVLLGQLLLVTEVEADDVERPRLLVPDDRVFQVVRSRLQVLGVLSGAVAVAGEGAAVARWRMAATARFPASPWRAMSEPTDRE